MRYNWNKDLKEGQDLSIFGSALGYLKECNDELILQVGTQGTVIENLINSMANRRVYIGASDRTQFAFSFLQYELGRCCCYNGEVRPDVYIVGKDANVPANVPATDIGIVISGSSLTNPAVNAMDVLTDSKVKTFFLTYTTPEQAKEEQKRIKDETGKIVPSVWDYFVKQHRYEERIIYLPMREQIYRREKRRASLAPMGTKFELNAGTTAMGLANGLRTYHASKNGNMQKETPIVSFLNTLANLRKLLDNDLPEQCYNTRFDIADFIQDLYGIPHKKLVGFGESEINVNSFVNRLTHCEHLGKGEKYENNKSVHILKSAYFGSISKNNMGIGISQSGDNPYTSFIMDEMKKQNPERIYLVTCHSEPKIKSFDKKIVLPPVISGNEEAIPNIELGYLTIFTFLDSCIVQLANKMGLDEEDMKNFHSKFG